jgi:glycosyltransferase involved in cell wall biosynthesis
MNGWFWNRPNVGLGQYTKWLIWGLLQTPEQPAITLVTPQPLSPSPRQAYQSLTPTPDLSRLDVLVRPTPFPNQHAPLSRLWFEQITFPNACRALNPDLIHIPYYGAPYRPVKPQIITTHDLIPLLLPEYRQEPILRLYGRLIAVTLPKANRLITPSQAAKSDLVAHLNLNPDYIHVIHQAPAPTFQCLAPTPYNRSPKTPTPTTLESRCLALQSHKPYVLYLGGYERRKNVETLLRAFHRARPHLPQSTTLILAGKLPQKDTAVYQDPRPLIQSLGLEKDVYLPGWIPEADLPALYQSADLFVYPSRYEGFGFPVLEAMACGTAVLTTNVTALPEIAGTAAAFVTPDDVDGMAEQIVSLITNRQKNQQLAACGLEHVQQYSWQKTANKTIQAYKDII